MYSVLVSILAKLNANTNLKALVTLITPFSTSDVNRAFYKAIKLQSDGVKGQFRFEFTAICATYPNAVKAIEEVEKSLLTLGDNTFSDSVLTIERNGGASMPNAETQTFHETAYFIISYKERM
jgi:CRISPR/Cas system CMR-associated protein Cmr1 (group 7 of RAMP superfamily)